MKYFFLIIFLLASFIGYSQNYALTQNIGSSNTRVTVFTKDNQYYGALQAQIINAGIFADTTGANGAPSVKLNNGAQIMTYSGGVKLWLRYSGEWFQVSGGSVNPGDTTFVNNGLNVVNSVKDTIQLGGFLVKNTTITNNGFWINFLSSGLQSTAIGYTALASGTSSGAYGDNAQAIANYAFAFGQNALASGVRSTAAGNMTDATGVSSGALFDNAQALADSCAAIGWHSIMQSKYGIAIGDSALAQPVIGRTRTTPSAKFEIFSTTGGLLIPRVNTAQMNAIVSPVTSLLVWNTDSATMCDYNGSHWVKVFTTGTADSRISSLTAATTSNTIDNAGFTQTWQFTNLNNASGIKLSSNSIATGSAGSKMLEISVTGPNGGSNPVDYGIYSSAGRSPSGVNQTNVAGYFSAVNGSLNYAAIFDQGNVGIGTTAPAKKLHTVGTVRMASLGTSSFDTTTNKPVGINSSGDIIPMGYWAGSGGGGSTNIYNSNGTLSGDRTLTGGAHSLTFTGLSAFTLNDGTDDRITTDNTATRIFSPNGQGSFAEVVDNGAGNEYASMQSGISRIRLRPDSSTWENLTRSSAARNKYLTWDTVYNRVFYSDGGSGGTNYWTLDGSNLYNNSGTNVGIGTSTPAGLLDVNDGTPLNGLLVNPSNGFFYLGSAGAGGLTIDESNSVDTLKSVSYDAASLTLNGSTKTANLRLNGNDLLNIDGGTQTLLYKTSGYPTGLLRIGDDGNGWIGDAQFDVNGTGVGWNDGSQVLTYYANNGHQFTGSLFLNTVNAASPGDSIATINTSTGEVRQVYNSFASTKANVLLTAQHASVASVATYTAPADGRYSVGGNVNVTAISAGALSLQVTYTDENSSSTTTSFITGISATGHNNPAQIIINAKSGTAITVLTTFSGVSVTYSVAGVIQAL